MLGERYIARVQLIHDDGSSDSYTWSAYGQLEMAYAVEEIDLAAKGKDFFSGTITAARRKMPDGTVQSVLVYERNALDGGESC